MNYYKNTTMNQDKTNILRNLTFKTSLYGKNYDIVDGGDNIITECGGEINLLRFLEEKKPLLIGEYSLSLWNLNLGRKLDINIFELFNEFKHENSYNQLYYKLKQKKLSLDSFDNLVLIHTVVIGKKYRKIGVFDELIETIYRDFYKEKTAIIILAQPFQNNTIDEDYYRLRREIINEDNISVTAVKYYSLDEFYEKKDIEINEYKLFDVVSKRGFSRIDDSNLFMFTPEKTINRILMKNKSIKLKEQ